MAETVTDERSSSSLTPEQEQRRQAALRHVRQYPDPVLRREAQPIETFDDELRSLIERMWTIMDEGLGVGLAATQLGLLVQVFTYRFEADSPPGALINPVIEWSSDELEDDDEGCLSLGDVRVRVSRPNAIKVSGKNPLGEDVTLELEGFEARVFQHEIDHLHGVLIIDKPADDEQRRQAMAVLRPRV